MLLFYQYTTFKGFLFIKLALLLYHGFKSQS